MERSNLVRVKLFKRRKSGLGFLVKQRKVKPYALVSDLVDGGCAMESGLVQVGDVIMRINDIGVTNMSYDSIVEILKSIPEESSVILLLQGPDGYDTHLETCFSPDGIAKTRRVIKAACKDGADKVLNNGTFDLQNGSPKIVVHGVSGEKINKSDEPEATVRPTSRSPVSRPSKSDIEIHQDQDEITVTVKNGAVRTPSPSRQNRRGSSPCSPKRYQKLRYLENENLNLTDTLHLKAIQSGHCTSERCTGSILQAPPNRGPRVPRPQNELINQAKEFIDQYYQSIKRSNTPAHHKRWSEVLVSIQKKGTYDLTTSELTFGAKTAWRNASRCIGRIQWSKLQVFDARHVTTARGMFEAICNHIKYGTNKGNIRSAITVFPQRTDGQHDFRIWNKLLIHYAGYRQSDGTIIGDPANAEFTEICQSLGWCGEGGWFDVLPLVLEANGQDPELFELPPELLLQVNLKHPSYDWFEDLGYRWYALPAVSDMMFDCGGLEFTACPFNGWYMGTEIGGRDLCDASRYNIIEIVAQRMGLDTKKTSSLWKDKALVEVNVAVMYSFQSLGVTIVDHHAASVSFMKHLQNEQRLRGGCPADWVWVVPPMSSSLCPVFHQEMLNYTLKPSYEYMEKAWKSHVWHKDDVDSQTLSVQTGRRHKRTFREIARAVKFSTKLMGKALSRRVKCTILYATETGKAETFAKTLCEIFKHAFDAKVMCMDEYDIIDLEHETLVLVVASTFGNGDPPENGEEFAKELYLIKYPTEAESIETSSNLQRLGIQGSQTQPITRRKSISQIITADAGALSNVRFSVFGLGSRAYPHFCAFAKYVDRLLGELGAERIFEFTEGDELCGQEDSFNNWARGVFSAACDTFCVGEDVNMKIATGTLSTEGAWVAEKYRLSPETSEPEPDITDALSKLHRKKVLSSIIKSVTNLQAQESSRETILVKMTTRDNTELSYLPGDHLAIFPTNDNQTVNALLDRLCETPDYDQVVNLETYIEQPTPLGTMKTWKNTDRFPPTSLRTAFSRFLDILTTPSVKMLQLLASYATDTSERDKLLELTKDPEVYEDWKHYRMATVLEVLQKFPSIKAPATLLMSQLPLLQQRFYSISSSPKMQPDEIHVTVAVVRYQTEGGTGVVHRGVCSSWLAELSEGDQVPCCVRSAPAFRLPDDNTVPVIMVGPGSGIAPFRSFWQQRKIDREMMSTHDGWGDMSMYFGCRQPKIDNIYESELLHSKEEGVLSEVFTAFSREPGIPKTYVQDNLKKNSRNVYNQVVHDLGHFYVCGDVSMAADVTETLQTILQHHGNMSPEQAKSYISKMRNENRFHEDIFGVTLRTSEKRDSYQSKAKKLWASNSMSNDNIKSLNELQINGGEHAPDTHESRA